MTTHECAHAPRRRRGFTFVEVLLALVLLAILAGVAAATVRAVTRSSEKTASMAHGSIAADQFLAHVCAGMPATNVWTGEDTPWRADGREETTTASTNEFVWTVWDLRREIDAPAAVRVATRLRPTHTAP